MTYWPDWKAAAERAKREHVARAAQTRDHTCHWPGCERQCKPAYWGCRPHWFKLPAALRAAIWATYEAGQEERGTPTRNYIDAAREVQAWIHTECQCDNCEGHGCKRCNFSGVKQ